MITGLGRKSLDLWQVC